ncbi:pyruvate, phosphate dikinase, partial [bacterium]|nr:pyruvate, phosphate dikinase [bacterium]
PLAVRSSGLFEDMLSQPCAGIYDTFILPNNDPDESIRLQQLTDAIKLIYCSIFSPEARAYFEAVNYKIEEEKMAVIIQKAVGDEYDGVFYPLISGTAQSFNYYPFGDFKPEDGICSLAVGMGNYVVDGGQAFQFSPSNPKKSLLPADSLRGKTQKFFEVIDMKVSERDLLSGEDSCYSKLDISEAERQGNLMHIASTFDINNGRIVPGTRKDGPRIINYANILQYGKFPLADTVDFVLKLGEYALNTPVEIEFALTFDPITGENPLFHLLQLKPVIQSAEECVIDRKTIQKKNLFLYSEKSMGNGRLETIKDIVFVKPDVFDKTETIAIAEEVEQINKILKKEGKECILIGPGRWGTRDRFLGIPVHFSQISSARVIVEAGLDGFEIDASLGSHFFHNITSMNIGYSNIPWLEKESFIDWDWIKEQRIVSDLRFVRHIELREPCTVVMDGKKRLLIIEK